MSIDQSPADKNIYIVISNHHVGGFEKRFVGLFLSLHKMGFCKPRLILSKKLIALLGQVDEFTDLGNYSEYFITDIIAEDDTYRQFAKKLQNFARKLPAGQVFHYIYVPTLYRDCRHKYISSYTGVDFRECTTKSFLSLMMGYSVADKIDVLDPFICKALKTLFFYKRGRISLTPGTCVDFSKYQPKPFAQKKNSVVSLGTITSSKQIDRLLRALPEVEDQLVAAGYTNTEYQILGRQDDIDVKQILAEDTRFEKMNIHIGFHPAPTEVLEESKVIFSLFRVTNYPSRALVEAMACGNIPVATAARNHELITKEEFSYLVPVNFTASDIFNAVEKVFRLDESEFVQKSQAGSDFVRKRFSFDESTKYFADLYLNWS